MTDYHAHVLPHMDDGPSTAEESTAMLKKMREQGVNRVIASSHFYPADETPGEFLARREKAYSALKEALKPEDDIPEIELAAEVYYFSGMSRVPELRELSFSCPPDAAERLLLVEPPMTPWPTRILDEIAEAGQNLGVQPVIAHVDRYMEILREKNLPERVLEKGLLVQFNAGYIIDNPKKACRYLKNNQVQFIGSDAHNLTTRPPNMEEAFRILKKHFG